MFEHIGMTSIIICCALCIDRLIGEPERCHPLILFGKWADYCRSVSLNICHHAHKRIAANQKNETLSENEKILDQRLIGIWAWFMSVVPWVIILSVSMFVLPDIITHMLSVFVLYFCIGWQSLREHAALILAGLKIGDISLARAATGRIVSRDTDQLEEHDIVKAGAESVLENGSDAIFAPIFWFVLLGAPGVLLYRLANTLDAMWGYKNATFIHFGWWAARFDDLLNYIPARLVILSYAACGHFSDGIEAAKLPEARWKSPNAGPVIAAGAGALGIVLGGKAVYFGKEEYRPELGVKAGSEDQDRLNLTDLQRAVQLVDRSVYLWVLLFCFCIFFSF